MSKVNYKYNIGDTVQFQEEFGPTATCGLKQHAGEIVKVVDQRYYGRPCYKFEGLEDEGWFTEGCIQAVKSNPYVVFAGERKGELEPIISAETKKTAIAEAKKLQATYSCVEAIYMPEDDLDINKIVYSHYNKET